MGEVWCESSLKPVVEREMQGGIRRNCQIDWSCVKYYKLSRSRFPRSIGSILWNVLPWIRIPMFDYLHVEWLVIGGKIGFVDPAPSKRVIYHGKITAVGGDLFFVNTSSTTNHSGKELQCVVWNLPLEMAGEVVHVGTTAYGYTTNAYGTTIVPENVSWFSEYYVANWYPCVCEINKFKPDV